LYLLRLLREFTGKAVEGEIVPPREEKDMAVPKSVDIREFYLPYHKNIREHLEFPNYSDIVSFFKNQLLIIIEHRYQIHSYHG
jgi:hypothetical protein